MAFLVSRAGLFCLKIPECENLSISVLSFPCDLKYFTSIDFGIFSVDMIHSSGPGTFPQVRGSASQFDGIFL